MKKILIFVLVIIVLVLIYWFVSPIFIDKKVSEVSPLEENNSMNVETTDVPVAENSPQLVANGDFNGFDKIHYGSGTASLIKSDEGYILRFEEDFDVANGPDLYVGLGKDGNYIKGSEISKLKGNQGSQNYILPSDFDITETNEVWVWCKAFSVPFAKAVLIK